MTASYYKIDEVSLQGVRSYMQQSRVFVGMVLILIFGEVLGLYGYIPPHRQFCAQFTDLHNQFDCRSDFEFKEGLKKYLSYRYGVHCADQACAD